LLKEIINEKNKNKYVMENNVMPSIVRMERKILEQLTREVKETVATGIEMSGMKERSFGVVDLWSMRRGKRHSRRTVKRWGKWEI
jgi:hypothetical protein